MNPTRKIRLLFSLLLSAGCARPALLSAGPPEAGTAAVGSTTKSDDVLYERLGSSFTDADYDGIDFSKVLEDLRQRHNINLVANWPALEAVGIERDHRVEVHLKHVPLSTLLDNILAMVGGETDLGYAAMNGILVVSTKEDLARRTELRLYDVTDLLGSQFELRRFANTPILRLQLAGGETTGGTALQSGQGGLGGAGGGGIAKGGMGGGGIFGGGAAHAPEPQAVAASFVDINSVIELLQSTIDPESWRDAGGNIGSIRPFGGSLLITQTVSAHQKIDAMLKLLRSNRPMLLDAQAAIISLSPADALKWRLSIGAAFPRLSADKARAAMSGEGVRSSFHGTTTGRNGQRLWFSSLSQRMIVASYTPVLGDGVWSVMPELAAVNEGLELIALPLVAPDDGSLTLDVQMAWSPPAQVRDKTVTLGPAVVAPGDPAKSTSATGAMSSVGAAVGSIELSARQMRTVSTTARLQLGEAIALSIPSVTGETTEEHWLIVHVRRAGQ